MSEFTPEDGAVYFAWRNTFHRVAERTYDWRYCHDDVVVDGGYVVQEIPYQESGEDIDWVRLIHERTFDTQQKVERYCSALQRRYARDEGFAGAPLRVETAAPRTPQSAHMYYDGSSLILPAPSGADAHDDPTGDPIHRERFISSRWLEGQRHWPIAEHHVLHELAHHVAGVEGHDVDFDNAFRSLLGVASKDKNFNAEIWDWELKIARRLLNTGDGAVDMVTQAAYDKNGAVLFGGAGLEVAA